MASAKSSDHDEINTDQVPTILSRSRSLAVLAEARSRPEQARSRMEEARSREAAAAGSSSPAPAAGLGEGTPVAGTLQRQHNVFHSITKLSTVTGTCYS